MALNKSAEAPGSAGTPDAGGVDEGDKVTKTGDPVPEGEESDWHKRLLRQRKQDQLKLQQLEDENAKFKEKEQDRERNDLAAKGEYDKALKAIREENLKLKTNLEQKEKDEVDRRKLSAVTQKLPGKVIRSEYLGFVNLDQIAVDPQTGEVDTTTVQQVADAFVKEHGHLITTGSNARLPSGLPAPNGKMSYEEWKKLPLAEKKKTPDSRVAWPYETKS